jgi:hypothetical protein
MELLEFARGPALAASLVIFFFGTAWRLYRVFRLGFKRDFSEPRSADIAIGALRTIITRMVPRQEFREGAALVTFNGYVYHVGLAIVAFGYLPHVNFIKRLTGISWPALPDWVFFAAVALTFVSLILALVHRLTDPVRRLISSFDDYFSWFIVFLPLVTGMAALGDPTVPGEAPGTPLYPGPVAVHLLSVELLLVWLPFGKLGHAFLVFVSRGMTGAAFARRGVRA